MRRPDVAAQVPLATLVALGVVTSVFAPRFLSPVNLTNVLVQGSIMAVIAMGMTFVIVGGGFDLSVGSIVALSGCVAAAVMLRTGIPLGVAAGVAAGALVGLVNGLTIAGLSVNPFITTLGTMVAIIALTHPGTRGSVCPVPGTGYQTSLRSLRACSRPSAPESLC